MANRRIETLDGFRVETLDGLEDLLAERCRVYRGRCRPILGAVAAWL
jgi:hypothetical protein